MEAEEEILRFLCPCCGFKTLPERGLYFICPVCLWEDSGAIGHEKHRWWGPNHGLTLIQARANFQKFRAADERLVVRTRRPRPEEIEVATALG